MVQVIRHPELAADIREVALHYAEISERVLLASWDDLEIVLDSIEVNPRSHHFDVSGLRRANLKKFPYHFLYQVEGDTVYLAVLRHDRRHLSFGLERAR